MHEHAPQEIRPGTPPAAAGRPAPGATAPAAAGEDRFSLRKKFPGEAAAAPVAPLPAPAVRGKSSRRVVIALIVFLGVIGLIAYVAQNLPNWRKREPTGGGNTDPTLVKELLKFPEDLRDLGLATLFHARWDHPDPKQLMYAEEIEKGTNGHYDFLLFNPLEQSVDLGIHESSCDCSRVAFAPLPSTAEYPGKQPRQSVIARMLPNNPSWTAFYNDDKTVNKAAVAKVPGTSVGVLRISWENRKSEGSSLNLQITMWAQAEGAKAKKRQHVYLHVPTLVVAPIQFERTSRSVGEVGLGGAKTNLACWSATRENPNLTLAAQDDPLFQWRLTKLTPDECKELEKSLNASRATRVKAGFRVSVVVFEEKDGKQLDQGSFNRYPPLVLDGVPLEHAGTRVEGVVRGDVQVAGEARPGVVEQGQVRFGTFKTNDGARADLVLRADAGVTLELVEREKQIPPYLQLKLTEDKITPDKKKSWRLELVVPAQIPAGPLPPNAAIVLRKLTQGAPPRQIRIPIIGNAVQG